MAKIKVCSRTVSARNVRSYGGGHIYPGARDIGSVADVSKATAKKLAADAGAFRPLRPGYEMKLCGDTWLENKSGRFAVVRRASGGFSRDTAESRR